uniref:Uncharacterized protein n=1 Tax=Prymnesium polylepis TaxID=72548 RepID=A0A6V4V1N5_9EUKA|mmetsp:Transcript_65234/g.178998  ORF Transcript_65234/g.178998 Transcript_65234/m.178998 type:complete len:188 (+) Transcript_65234:127-690(+)
MFRRNKKTEEREEIIFDCPCCEEQLIVDIPTRRTVIIQCGECGAKCSVKQARKGKKTWDQAQQDAHKQAPVVEVTEIVPELGSKEGDIVRAASLKPGGKAALERARQAKESKRTSQASHRGSLPGAAEDAPASAPPGPIRRSSSRLANKADAPYTRQGSGTGLTPLMSSAALKEEGSAFPDVEGDAR